MFWTSAWPGRLNQQRREALHPPVHRDVINLDAAFGQQLLDVPDRTARTAATTALPV